MATTAKTIAVGNLAGFILPKQTQARLNVQKGDTLYITEVERAELLQPPQESSVQGHRLAIPSRDNYAPRTGSST